MRALVQLAVARKSDGAKHVLGLKTEARCSFPVSPPGDGKTTASGKRFSMMRNKTLPHGAVATHEPR